jgi:tetratricopeptide (TPR) repeat protein
VYSNPGLNPVSWEHWASFWSAPFKGLYIPVTYSVWSFLAWLSPGGAQWAPPFHFVNVFVHAMNALLVLEIFCTLGIAEIPAVLGTALFALHPLQVESVAWVTGLKELLFGFFALASLLFFLQSARRVPNLAAAFLLSILAALCKPSAIMLPLVFAWAGAQFLEMKPRELLRTFVPWMFAMLPIGLVAMSAQPLKAAAAELTILQRLEVAGEALAFYLAKFLFPFPLLPQYDHSISKVLSAPASAWLAAAATFALVALILKGRRELKFGLGVFVLLLFPVLGIFPFWYQDLSTVADHYTYLPLFGLSFVLAFYLRGSLSRIVAAVVIVALAICSFAQTRIWEDGKTLAVYTLRYNPDSPPAHLDLGLAYRDENRLELAAEEFRTATRLQSGYGDAYVDLGSALATMGKYHEAVDAFLQAVEIQPASGVNQFNLAKAMTFDGHLTEAAPHFIEAIRDEPSLEFDVQLFVGDALSRQGYVQAAKMHYADALRARPGSSLILARLKGLDGVVE